MTRPTLLLAAVLFLSALPISQPPPSTFLPLYETGVGWAEDEYTTGIAFGDIDGDGRDETAIARFGTAGPRILLSDDAVAAFALLWTFGEGWGVGGWPTSVAFGNVDDDPAEELAVARATAVNERVWVFDDAAAGFAPLVLIGKEWPSTVYAVALAFGDADGDGRDELGVATNATEGTRATIYGDVSSNDDTADFAPLWTFGEEWGAPATATAIAFGDADGDGIDEIALARNHNIFARFFVYEGAPDFALLWQAGDTWGAGSWATGVAFGNVDDDPAEELGVTRNASLNERAYVFDDATTGFATLQLFGQTWAANAYATGIAFGDVDGDGRDEVGLARYATVNERFAVYDDAMPRGARPAFARLWTGGDDWPGTDYATSIAFGNVDATPDTELGVGRYAAEGSRAYILLRGWVGWVPFVQ